MSDNQKIFRIAAEIVVDDPTKKSYVSAAETTARLARSKVSDFANWLLDADDNEQSTVKPFEEIPAVRAIELVTGELEVEFPELAQRFEHVGADGLTLSEMQEGLESYTPIKKMEITDVHIAYAQQALASMELNSTQAAIAGMSEIIARAEVVEAVFELQNATGSNFTDPVSKRP